MAKFKIVIMSERHIDIAVVIFLLKRECINLVYPQTITFGLNQPGKQSASEIQTINFV